MPGFTGYNDLYNEIALGKLHSISYRKVTSNANAGAAGSWYEFLTATGSPRAVSFSGSAGVATAMNRSTSGALPLNGDVSTDLRFLFNISFGSNTSTVPAGTLILCDFLLYYPNININASPTALNNTVTLPRYTSGNGVMASVIVTTPLTTSAPALTFTWTDNGNNSRSSVLTAPSATAVASTLFANNGHCFLPMDSGAIGVKKLDSYTIASGTATGAATAILYKPLAMQPAITINAQFEKNYFFDMLNTIKIEDNACLGFIYMAGGNMAASSVVQGDLQVVWG